MQKKMHYVNLGCGIHYHEDWINFDFVSASKFVTAHNLLQGIPLTDNSADVVYHSHVLEHFPKDKAPTFLSECYRVLKPGGIMRIAVPDLERIVGHYTRILRELEARPNDERLLADYDWILLEMYDQTVRNESGGSMAKFLTSGRVINKAFILERCGEEVRSYLEIESSMAPLSPIAHKPSMILRLLRAIRSGRIKKILIRLLLGEEYKLLEVARFRSHGEIHQWMYDKVSIRIVLEKTGFVSFEVKSAFESAIPGWNSFNLEGKEGKVRKPDSLFIEVRKPA